MQSFIFAAVSPGPIVLRRLPADLTQRANPGLKRCELRVNGAAACRNKPGANACAKVEPVSSVEANQDGIEAVSPWRVAADDKLLRKLDAHLGLCAVRLPCS